MMKDPLPAIVVAHGNFMDALRSASISIHEKYFRGNSEAYGNLQNEEYPPENPGISYFMGDA